MNNFASYFTNSSQGQKKKGRSAEKRRMEFSKSNKRRKSLDETLINPIKSLMGIARSSGRKQHNKEDETMKIETFLNGRRGSDDYLQKRLKDPLIQEHLKTFHTRSNSLQENKINSESIINGDDMECSRKTARGREIDKKNKKEIDRSSSFKNKEIEDEKLKKTEKKCGHRRRKSENEFMKIIRDVSIERIRNIVKRSSSVKDEKRNEAFTKPQESLLKNEMKNEYLQNDNEMILNIRAVKRQRHVRTKSESEVTVHARVTRSSSLLDNPLLIDTTDMLYKKKLLGRTRSASDTDSMTKTDKSIKERLKNALGRSRSFNESKESVFNQKPGEGNKSGKSIKDRIKNLVGRSSSFKHPEKEKINFTRKRAGSDSEIFIANKSFADRLLNTLKKSSSLKEKVDNVTESKDQTCSSSLSDLYRNSVVLPSSTKDKSASKRRIPAIVRRISKQKNRKESDTEEGDTSNNDDDNTSCSDVDQSVTPTPSPSSSSNTIADQTDGGNSSSRTNHRLRTQTEPPRRVVKRNVSRSNSLQRKIDRKNYAKNKENTPSTPPMTSRSMSVGDVLAGGKIYTSPNNARIRRNLSLREDRSAYMNNVSPSPMILHASQERLDCNANLSITDKNEIIDRAPKKKKGLLQPLRNHIRRRSVGRDEITETQKYLKLDNSRLEKFVTELLYEKMNTIEYDHKLSNDRCRILSTCIENALKIRLESELDYKIVALVFIGEKRDHGICFATQCCYEPNQDLFATATYDNDHMFICACVFASLLPEVLPEVVG